MRRIVARFWNREGHEMPALLHDPEHGLTCTWNYLLLVAPHHERIREAAQHLLDTGIYAQDRDALTNLQEALAASGGGTVRDTATRARPV